MKKLSLIALATLSFGAQAQSYVGFGFGQGDYSKLTAQDRELTKPGFTVAEDKMKPNAYSVFLGRRLNETFSQEISYVNLGSTKTSGYVVDPSIASASGETRIQGLGFSILANHNIGNFAPYVRLGLMFTERSNEISINDPNRNVFQNPNSGSSNAQAFKPIYGIGVEYKIDKNFSIRADHTVIRHALTDYINNINNGYIKRDASITTLGLVYQFGEENKAAPNKSLAGWSVGYATGASKTDARMTNGTYSGRIWDLQTNALYPNPVSGAMSDDKSDTTFRYSFFKDDGQFEYEFYIATLGEFKSRSAVDGIAGSGNALTGAAQRTANAYGANIGYKLKVAEQVHIVPRVGLALVHARDEIYNNLDFTGVGGTERGPVVKKSTFTPTLGIAAGYQVNKAVEFRVSVDHFSSTGTDSTLGKGNISSVTAGVKVAL